MPHYNNNDNNGSSNNNMYRFHRVVREIEVLILFIIVCLYNSYCCVKRAYFANISGWRISYTPTHKQDSGCVRVRNVYTYIL